jgi:hypothetical protein
MLTYAVIVFAIGALGGLGLASFVLRGRLAPWALGPLPPRDQHSCAPVLKGR